MQDKQKKSFALGYSYVGLGFTLYIICTIFTSTGLSTLINFLCAKTGMEAGTLTSFNTIGALIGTVFICISSKLVQKIGTRPVICLGLTLTAVASFLLSVCYSRELYILIAILGQVGMAFYFAAGTGVLITNWFPRTKGFIMGITSSGMMATTFTYIAFITHFEPLLGFDTIMRGTAVVILVLAIACWFWIKEKPEDVGLLPDNKPLDAVSTQSDVVNEEAQKDTGKWTAFQMIFSRQGILIMLVYGLASLVARGDAVGKIPFMKELGFENATALTLVSALSVVSITGSVLIGWLDTKLGTKKATMIFAAIYSVSFFASYFASGINPILTVCTVAFTYFAQGANANLITSMLGTSYGRKNYAKAMGSLYVGVNILVAFSYLAVGRVLTMFGAYRPTKLLFGVLMIISLLLSLLLKDGYVPAPKSEKDNVN